MYSVDKILIPKTKEEVLGIISRNPEAVLLAGGTDVFVKMRKHNISNAVLVSLEKIQELKGIAQFPDRTISIGPLTTFSDIANSQVLRKKTRLLTEAALSMGGPQIRNRATIGGNICNGAVSADSAPALLALKAKLILHSLESWRTVPIEEFYLGPGKVDLRPGEVLTNIIIPAENYNYDQGSTYIKFSVRNAMDLAIVGAAVVCSIDEDKRFRQITIALGAAAPVPIRCQEAEEYLKGKIPLEKDFEKAGELAVLSASPHDSWRASRRYRMALIKVLTDRAVKEAYRRARGNIYDKDTDDGK